MTLRADLVNAFKNTDKRFNYCDPQDISVSSLDPEYNPNGVTEFPIYITWGGRQAAGNTARLREVWHVNVILGSMRKQDPWEDVDYAIGAALDVCYSVQNAFPELLSIISGEIAPQDKSEKYAAAVIQVLGV